MADTQYLEALVDAIREVYQQEQQYFDKLKGCEQAVSFRIAHRMANLIEPKQHNINVDCEVRKCNGIIKIDSRRPDIVVHKRNGTGYIVVEIKCDDNKREWNNDFDKLVLFTHKDKPRLSSDDIPTYELGAFVYLADNEQDVAIRIYENGEIVTEKSPYSEILKGFKYA